MRKTGRLYSGLKASEFTARIPLWIGATGRGPEDLRHWLRSVLIEAEVLWWIELRTVKTVGEYGSLRTECGKGMILIDMVAWLS